MAATPEEGCLCPELRRECPQCEAYRLARFQHAGRLGGTAAAASVRRRSEALMPVKAAAHAALLARGARETLSPEEERTLATLRVWLGRHGMSYGRRKTGHKACRPGTTGVSS